MATSPVIAVTGANGYVGEVVTRAISETGQVIRLVRVQRGKEDQAWSFEMTEQETTRILSSAGVTHVVHVAWSMRPRSLEELQSSCVAGTGRLLNAARSAGVNKFIFISTISAFAGTRSAYGKAKLKAERLVQEWGGLVFRLGLVYGNGMGGVFGSLSRLAARSPVIPLIAGGPGVQYLLHERSLGEAVVRAIRGDFDCEQRIVTLASPAPVQLRDLMETLATRKGRKLRFVLVHWRLVYFALWTIDWLGFRVGLSRDNLVGFVFQNPDPDFSALVEHDIRTASFIDPAQGGGGGDR